MEELAANKIFGGQQLQCQHSSESLNCDMQFSIYLPPQAEAGKVPAVYWLSGLTCTDQNFVTKAGAQQHAAEHGATLHGTLPGSAGPRRVSESGGRSSVRRSGALS